VARRRRNRPGRRDHPHRVEGLRSDAEPGLGSVDQDPREVRGVGGFEIGGAGDTSGAGRFLVGAGSFLEPCGEAPGSVGDGHPGLLSPGTGAQDQECGRSDAGQGIRREIVELHQGDVAPARGRTIRLFCRRAALGTR
jgi:hypothetical protein